MPHPVLAVVLLVVTVVAAIAFEIRATRRDQRNIAQLTRKK